MESERTQLKSMGNESKEQLAYLDAVAVKKVGRIKPKLNNGFLGLGKLFHANYASQIFAVGHRCQSGGSYDGEIFYGIVPQSESFTWQR
jgi:hypothetical protein